MYSKTEASQLRQEFWMAFGQYMSPILSSDGEKINWINYKTGEKDIYFRMNADNKKASIGIELSQKDTGMQVLYFEQVEQLQKSLESTLQESWIWLPQTVNEQGKITSRIYTELNNTSVFKREDWPQLISFFKPRIVALDEWWSTAKYVFELLR